MNIPCKDCIVFAICKSSYIKKIAGCTFLGIDSMYLRCHLFREWYLSEKYAEEITFTEFGLAYYGGNKRPKNKN
jgi:hypothetical protein